MKNAILRVSELVLEGYRQKFRGHRKTPHLTYVEFARDKGSLFDRWCATCKFEDFSALHELIHLEEFEKNLLEHMLVYIIEQKVTGGGLSGSWTRDLSHPK